MPIRSDLKPLYPHDWHRISRYVRFDREKGICQSCGRRHGDIVHRLPDGRWYDPLVKHWRSGSGSACSDPDLFEFQLAKPTKVILAAAHLDNNPGHNEDSNWAAFCQRCHLLHDAPYHRDQRRLTQLRKRAHGDLFAGAYATFVGRLIAGETLTAILLPPSGPK